MLITQEYRQQMADLHARGNFGVMGSVYAPTVASLIGDSKTILDYGAGRCALRAGLEKIGLDVSGLREYDPGVDALSADPEPADMVVCLDVLEHIEPDCIDNVLRHMRSLSTCSVLATITLVPAKKTLADGRNAHILLRPIHWWMGRLCSFWEMRLAKGSKQTLVFYGESL